MVGGARGIMSVLLSTGSTRGWSNGDGVSAGGTGDIGSAGSALIFALGCGLSAGGTGVGDAGVGAGPIRAFITSGGDGPRTGITRGVGIGAGGAFAGPKPSPGDADGAGLGLTPGAVAPGLPCDALSMPASCAMPC